MNRAGDVTAIGPDVKHVKTGSTVLYSRFGIGCTDVVVAGEEYTMIREQDLIGTLPSSGARANDIPKLQPCGDRVLLSVEKAAAETKGGILLTEGSKEKPTSAPSSPSGRARRAKKTKKSSR